MRIVLGGLMLLAALRLDAHHSMKAEYDENKVVALRGTITKVEWMNPHARFWIDVKDADGKTLSWEVELGSPNTLMKNFGWSKGSLKQGDSVTVEAFHARDNSNLAAAETLTLADGQVLKADPQADWAMGGKK